MDTVDSPSTRTLNLLSLLQTGREWSVSDLASRMQVSERTVRRDAQRLRGMGYDLRSRPGPGAVYRLRPSVKIPPLLFDPDEVSAIIAGLLVLETWAPGDESVATTRAKLDQVLPRSLRQRAAATAMSTQILQDPVEPLDWTLIGVIADAVAASSRVQFHYTDRHGHESLRTVEPFRHFLRRQRWYLVAFDIDREDWRLFRLDRIRDAQGRRETFHPREFPARTIEQWLTTDFGRVL